MKLDRFDFLIFIGMVVITIGLAMWWLPGAFLFFGLVCMVAGLLGSRLKAWQREDNP
ncbi:MAG TPA: hypothetical protein VFF78_06965 [Anaerolineaceae bacterium]|nr:hypothetical protein [Anaerolineaceae bacterium]